MFDDPCMRPRYHSMPDPIETADDSDKTLPPAIRYVDFGGDYDTYFEIKVIGPYPDASARDRDLRRLESLPLGDPELNGIAQFYADRLGSVQADEVVEPERISRSETLRQFLAHWDGSSEADYWEDDVPADPYEVHPDRIGLFS